MGYKNSTGKKYNYKTSSRKMKILYYDKSIGFGGALVCLSLTLKYLNKRKFYPFVATSCEDKFIDLHIVPYTNKHFYLKKYNIKKSIGYWLTIIEHTIKLSYIIKKTKINILHANNGLYTNAAAFMAGKICNIPTICHQKMWASSTKLDHILCRYPKYYIAISNAVKKSIINLLKIPEEKIKIIYPGIDIKKFNIKKTRETRKLTKIGILGCLIPWKGHEVFIKAIYKLNQMNIAFKAYIIGDAPPSFLYYEKYLKELSNQLKLNTVLVFKGRILDIWNIVNSIDIMVHASIDPEPFGRVIVESMALEKPVIATNLGGPSEIIKHNKTGILIPPNNPDLLASEIKNLILNEKLRIEMGKRARKDVIDRFDICKLVASIESIYSNLL